MADVAFLKLVLDNLSSLIKEEIGLMMGVSKEMNKLSSNLTAIQAVLADAETQQFKRRDIRDWLCKLTNVAYEIDDILDECETQVSIAKHNNKNMLNCCCLGKILFRHKIGKRIKEVCENLDVINAERTNFRLQEMVVPRQNELVDVRETGSILDISHKILGRDEEKEIIVDMLVNHAMDYRNLFVLPIIGVGGLGKTTLAQLVFNEARIVEHFEKRIWVCVSDNFHLQTLLKAIIKSATKSGSSSNLTLDTLQHRVQELLKQKKFLIVLDDVWNDDQDKWYKLRNVIACGLEGSSIVVTTRLKKVAKIMETRSSHNLKDLSDDDCWLLFKEHALRRELDENPKLVAIGKQIVKKCDGVPLAAKALGGLLRFKEEEKQWLRVKESELWDLKETSILPALRLSYHNLPLELRQCFTYCAIFPKDTRINKDELILFWMAHGYITSSKALEAEDVGDEVWKELVLRSLFQDVLTNDSGEITFTLHDLVHDLAQSITENKFVAIIQPDTTCRSSPNSRIRQVNYRYQSQTLCHTLTNFNRVRMLNASCECIYDVPSIIGKMKHLRYLNLSRTNICHLPKTIVALWNLHTLVLEDCLKLRSLPYHMRNLVNMSYLFLSGCQSLEHMPPKLGEMTSLKRLSNFIVGKRIGSQLGELKFLSLGGKLHINHLERVENHIDAKEANLKGKQNLRELRFEWHHDGAPMTQVKIDDQRVLDALEPHSNLKILEIFGFKGMHFPLWMKKSTLENIVKICIENCENCSHLPQLGELPNLKFLVLRELRVEYISDDEYQVGTFPSLQKLSLSYLPNLIRLSRNEVGETLFPSLHSLELVKCPLLTLPPLLFLKEVKAMYCSSLTLCSFSKLHNLTSLDLEKDQDMTYLSNENQHGHDKLCSLEEALQGLKSLKTLRIDGFNRFSSLSGGELRNLTTLETLEINDCPEFVELPDEIRYLQSLKHLNLSNCHKLKCLPEALRDVTSLQSICLAMLPEFTALPDTLEGLTSLHEVTIMTCPQLKSLPYSIRQRNNSQDLYIYCGGCPELERRLEDERREITPDFFWTSRFLLGGPLEGLGGGDPQENPEEIFLLD